MRQSRFISQGKYLLLFGFLAVFMGNFGQSFFIGSYGAAIQESLQLSASGYGLTYSIATLFAGTSLMFVGGYIDRLPLFRFTVFVSLGLFVACVLFVFADNLLVLLAAFFLVRLCGQGLLPHTGITVMARSFDANRGKAISIAASGVPFGEIILPLLAAWLIAQVGWQQSWLYIAVFIPLFFVPLAALLVARAKKTGFQVDPEPCAEISQSSGDKARPASASRTQVLKDGRFWRALPTLVAAPFIVTGIFIHQGFVMAERAWSHEVFAAGFVVYGIVHWLSSLAAGWLVDRYRAVRLLPFYNLSMMLGLLAVVFVDGYGLVFVLLATLGIAIGGSGPIAGSLWPEVYGTANLGAIRSMVSSFGVWSTSLSPVLFGFLIDAGITLTQLFSLLAVYVLLASLLAAVSYRAEPTLSKT